VSAFPAGRHPVGERAHRAAATDPGPRPSGPAGTGPAGSAGRRPPARPRAQHARVSGSAPEGLARLAFGFAELFCEVEAGRRPRPQLEPLLTPWLYARLAPYWVRPGVPARVVRLHAQMTGADTLEAVAILQRSHRVSALVLRLAHRGERWTIEEAGRPEDGVLPQPTVPPPTYEPDSFDLVLR
jgi:hypothetical protein